MKRWKRTIKPGIRELMLDMKKEKRECLDCNEGLRVGFNWNGDTRQ